MTVLKDFQVLPSFSESIETPSGLLYDLLALLELSLFIIEVLLICNVLLVSGVKHRDSTILYITHCSAQYTIPLTIPTVLLTIFSMLYFSSLWLIYLIAGSLYLLYLSPISSIPSLLSPLVTVSLFPVFMICMQNSHWGFHFFLYSQTIPWTLQYKNDHTSVHPTLWKDTNKVNYIKYRNNKAHYFICLKHTLSFL